MPHAVTRPRSRLALLAAAMLAVAGAGSMPQDAGAQSGASPTPGAAAAAADPTLRDIVTAALAGYEWRSPGERSHPLVGRILDARSGVLVAPAGGPPTTSGAEALPAARVLLLGEVHDNADHHGVRGRMLAALGKVARPLAVVSEHLRADQADDLARFEAQRAADGARPGAADFFRIVGWNATGWGAEALFATLYAGAIEAAASLHVGDPPRAMIRRLAREGLGVLAEGEARRLGLEAAWPDPLQEALLGELEASHCGLMPRSAFKGLALAQRYRDAHQADGVLRAGEDGRPVVLLAGNGHVRLDRGVPWYVRQRRPQAEMAAVAFVEVEAGRPDPASYVPRTPDGRPAVDLVVFTPRAERPDPCEEMRKGFGGAKRGG